MRQPQTELRVAVLGVGMMGSYHTRTLSRRIHGARVTVVTDADTDRAAHVAAEIGARTVADPLDAINADDVDGVLIASPGPAHEKQVQACLERRIPVLCEKPLTVDADSAYNIVVAEHSLGRQMVQVGFMRRFDGEYAALRALIASGGLGAPLMLHCLHRNPTVPDSFDSAMMITDSLIHEVDVTRFLLADEITAVSVYKPTSAASAPARVHDPMFVIFETSRGYLVDVEIFVRTGVAYEVRAELVGEHGTATIGRDQHLLRTSVDGRSGGTLASDFIARFDIAYQRELQAWVDAAGQGSIAGPGVWDGYAAIAVCSAGIRALRTGERADVVLKDRP